MILISNTMIYKWEKIVERREKNYLKSYLLVYALKGGKKILGFNFPPHLTTRRGESFIHWKNVEGVNKFGLLISNRVTKKIFLSSYLSNVKKLCHSLVQVKKSIKLRDMKKIDNYKIFKIYAEYNRRYQNIYPYNYLTVCFDFFENIIKDWLREEGVSGLLIDQKVMDLLNKDNNLKSVPKEIRNNIFLLRNLTTVRFLVRKTFLDADNFSIPLFKELGCRLNLDKDSVKFLRPEELRASLLQKKRVPVNKIKNRFLASTFLFYNGKVEIFDGQKAFSYISRLQKEGDPFKVTLLSGLSAYNGKVRGRVSIINEKSDMYKMKKGKILLSRMTTPQLMPVIKKAKAIVTDEGGITCHAAIVARELKKPCIIGTKIATKVFKDGDRVEVDANSGIVRKLDIN